MRIGHGVARLVRGIAVLALAVLLVLPAPASRADDPPAGVGVVLKPAADGKGAVVQRVVENGPASMGGLAAGDEIVSVDGDPVAALDLNAVIARLRGAAGTKVRVVYRHPGDAEPHTVTLSRVKLDPAAGAAGAGAGAGGGGRGAPSTAGLSEPFDPPGFAELLPEVRNAPAPSWVKPGLRITYFSAAASIRGARTEMVEDENGNWVDKGTGRKYSEQEVASGGSGAGYTQVDVVALDAKAVALSISSWSVAVLPGKVTPLGVSGVVTPPGAGSDFWIHPDVLRKALAFDGKGMRVVRMPYKIGDRVFKAIRLQYDNAQGYQAWTYDEETGLLIRSGSSTQGAAQTVAKAGEAPGQGATLLTMNTFVTTRQVNVPWAASPAPPWVASTRRIAYRGTQAMPVPGSPTTPFPCTVEIGFLRAGPSWLRFEHKMEVGGVAGMPPTRSEGARAAGSASYSGLWLPPDAAASLRVGQELDRDPTTRVVTAVTWRGRSPQGNEVVTVTQTGDAHRSDAVFDVQTGLLVSARFADHLFVTELAFTGRE